MAEENRVRYRLSVSPEINERVEKLATKIGLHPQQAAYACMGLGLNMLEQITGMMDRAANDPQLLTMISAHMQPEMDKETDQITADMLKQK